MKRIGCLIAALSLLMTLSACHTGGEAEPTLRIGVALYQQEDTFIETVTRELQRVALEKEQRRTAKSTYISPMEKRARPARMSRWTASWRGDMT